VRAGWRTCLSSSAVRTTLATLFIGGACRQLQDEMRVDVEGLPQLDDSVLALSVSMKVH
jgi:hypothetical protein